jgi:hypothetical protein
LALFWNLGFGIWNLNFVYLIKITLMQSRRSFIQQAALVAAGLAIQPTHLLAGGKPKAIPSKLGIQLYTLRDELSKDVKGTIAKVAQATLISGD